MAAPDSNKRTVESLITDRIEDWRRHLIDLSLRNRLINYRPTKSSTLRIESPSLEELLADPEQSEPFDFFFPDDPDSDNEADETVATPEPGQTPEPDQIVTGLDDPKRLEKILANLARRSNAEFEDKALRVLHLGACFLNWEDVIRREQLRSPLILVPVELRRDSPREPYRLYFATDEEIVINPALTVKLEKDAGLDIPEDWAWENQQLSQELDEVRAAIAETNWTIDEEAVLGLFSFQKMVMYRDLQRNEDKLTSHPLVRALASSRVETELHDPLQGVPSVQELDSAQDPRDSFSILDSDASQRRCIEAAKQGKSFVMQGPPGTGKSQTIANIIAEALGQGKRVLFISEKMAALDVVHKRLAAKGLSDFCLKLHGRDAARKEVVNALDEALTGVPQPRKGLSERDFEQLFDARQRLNAAVELLHQQSSVLLDMSPREVYGELASLDGAPALSESVAASDMNGAEARRELNELSELFETIRDQWDVVSRPDFIWREYNGTSFNDADRSRVLETLDDVESKARAQQESTQRAEQQLGLGAPTSIQWTRDLCRLGGLLRKALPVEPHWLRADDMPELRSVITSARDVHKSLEETQDLFHKIYPHRESHEFSPDIDSRLADALSGLSALIGRSDAWEEQLTNRIPQLAEFAGESEGAFNELEDYAQRLYESLGQPWRSPTLSEIQDVKQLAELSFQATDRPDRRWLVSAGLQKASITLEKCRELFSGYQAEVATLSETYATEVMDLDADAMLERAVTAGDKFLGKLGGGYRNDLKSLRGLRKDGKSPSNPVEDLQRIQRARQLGAELDAGAADHEAAFGEWHKGRETDVDGIGSAIEVARQAQAKIAPDTHLGILERQLCVGTPANTELAQSASLVEAALSKITAGVDHIETLSARPEFSDTSALVLGNLRLKVGELAGATEKLVAVVRQLREGRANDTGTLSQLKSDADLITSLVQGERWIESESARWTELLGATYCGADTDWDGLEKRANWLGEIFELLGKDPSPELERTLLSGNGPTADFAALRDDADAFEAAALQLASLFDADRAAEIRELAVGAPTSETVDLCVQLRGRTDTLPAWTDFRASAERISRQGWGSFLDQLIAADIPAGEVGPAFLRAYWNSRLDRLFEKTPSLKEFRGRAHERLIESFSELDRQLISAAADRIITVCNEKRPAPIAVPGGEVALLKREAKKKKRHLPVRKLLQKLPALLPALKPCLMMSPLTVSHFLSTDHHFDLVIFDEASQVPPWDAINCIYRADQLIVVGDGKQLPPTPFFQQVDPEDETPDDDAEIAEEVMESILDSCEVLMPAESLRWHYRSRHEHLISFSNHHFYDNKLVTFPAPVMSSGDQGVHLIHVPDGVYDRARSRTNRIEARRVAGRVIEHLRTRPNRTVGVVAFSVSQAEAIIDELDLLRTSNPDLDHHFSGDRLDGVFVKNLESVQGDERDVIIFSVGYAYDEHRRFHKGFGPLNKEGGHRRLNVAVTRARQQVDVVTSVLCSDFDLSETAAPGAQRLRDYLEFAERGPEALRSEIESMGGDYESPFEESVAKAVRDLGYQVIPQVGVGGFRIDLGVVDPTAPGRFALGIECDGATYHSTPTARDRDRLRQEVLEGLQWRIHRIWSWDWVRERHKEVERLDQAIKQALESPGPEVSDSTGATLEEEPREREAIEVHEIHSSDDAADLPWAERYEPADISGFRSAYEFHEPECRPKLRRALKAILNVEAPISIDRMIKLLAASQEITRRGSRVVEAANIVIDDAIKKEVAERRGEFLWQPKQEIDRVRIPDNDPRTKRSIEEIPPEELDLAIAKLREAGGAVDGATLLAQTARIFGFSRTGAAIREQLEAHIEIGSGQQSTGH